MWLNRPPLRKGDAKALLIASTVSVGVIGVMLYFAADLEMIRAKVNNGFGPGWKCMQPDRGDPICVKSRP